MMKTWLHGYQQQFSSLIHTQKLPHALLFHGMKGSGKQQLSDWLVQVLACQNRQLSSDNTVFMPCMECKHCLLFASNTYPDHQQLLAEKATLGVDDIRRANSFLEKTAFFNEQSIQVTNVTKTTLKNSAQADLSKKTIVIPSAEQMTIAAANALLKTLEEPSNNSVLILLTTEIDSLLPTIISRCRVIHLRPQLKDQLPEYAQLAANEPFANHSHLPELSDPQIKQNYQGFVDALVNYLHYQQGFTEMVSLFVEEVYALRWFEKIIVSLMRETNQWQACSWQISDEHIAWLKQRDSSQLWQLYQQITHCNKQLKQYNQANKQFMVEQLLINCTAILLNTAIKSNSE